MMYKKILLAICVLMLCTIHKVIAQSSFEKDSLKLEQLTKGMETYFTNPFLYQQDIPKAYDLVNKLIEQKPDHAYLKLLRTKISDLNYSFIRRELNYEEGLKILLKNVREREEIKDTCGLSKSYRNLGNFWKVQGNYEKALPYLKKSIQISIQCNDFPSQVRSKMSLSAYYFSLENLDKAKEISIEALKLAKKHNDIGGIANANYQISRNYNLRKKYKESLIHLKRAEEGFKQTQNISSLERVNSTYANFYRKNGDPEKAISYFKKAIQYNLKLRDSSRLMYRYLGLSNSYRDIKDFKNAYYSYLNYKGMQKRINDKKEYGKLIELETRLVYENQKRIDSIQFAQQKALDEQKIKEKANTRFWLYVLALSVILVVVLIFYILNRQRIKEQAYQNILLNKKVATKTEEIQELLHETMKHLKSKEKLTSDLQKYSREEDGITLQSILTDLRASKADDTKLKLIKENIEKVNFEFLQVLKEKHSNLTKTEIEVCSFIKMGLSRKEISEVRGTSDFAVKTMRNRIRKKIKINSTITLDNYLTSIS